MQRPHAIPRRALASLLHPLLHPLAAPLIAASLLLTSPLAAQDEPANEPTNQPAIEPARGSLGSPAAPGEPVSLDELLEYAGTHAPELLLARQQLDLGDAARRGAAALLRENPELEASLDADLSDSAAISRWEVGLWQRFEIAGQQGLRRDLAARYSETLEAELNAVAWSVHQQVHRLYRAALVHQRAVELQQEVLTFTERLSQIAKLRFEAGEEAKLSMVLGRAEQARAHQRLLQARAAYLASLRDLAVVSGWTDANPPRPVDELGDPRAVEETDELVERAIANDPQLAVLRARLAQRRAQLSLERREIWLDPALGVGYEREETVGVVEHQLLVGLSLPLPLWNQNDEAVATAEAQAGIAEQRIAVRSAELQSRVRRAAALRRASAEQVEVFQDQVLPALQEQLDLLLRGFELGELDLLDVMAARDRLLSARSDALDALQAYYETAAALEELLGAPGDAI